MGNAMQIAREALSSHFSFLLFFSLPALSKVAARDIHTQFILQLWPDSVLWRRCAWRPRGP